MVGLDVWGGCLVEYVVMIDLLLWFVVLVCCLVWGLLCCCVSIDVV